MDPLEEQRSEIEVLESIYPDELTKYNDKHFSIDVLLDTPSERKHILVLDVKYPDEYPNVIPDLRIEKGADPAASHHGNGQDDDEDEDEDEKETKRAVQLSEHIELEREDLAQLLSRLTEEAEIQIGMPSVFALTTLLKDEAEALFREKLKVEQDRYDKKMLAREKEEQKKFNGTKVTKESWAAWFEALRKELKPKKDASAPRKMTGREIFEKGLAGVEDEETINAITENTKNITVS
ncbi:Piso0_003613 [Millerozyma farinosa CBS 7064]|uniref:Piso0_003613 protein n=1 Tax=Pichia sorbitophila (strain ATCC MYA-4447 / BCRC 22081 / CBS 7064 / NBRC 10061 / NRRL Y-12695) TaxID=559304 RepID=G8YGE4_PICSO|nr:Piso0_003613 [Millerozyma farinosa CBS 7064]CCE81261.1 Piso0_003613 [Millerozyma farinosa CBS 7064]